MSTSYGYGAEEGEGVTMRGRKPWYEELTEKDRGELAQMLHDPEWKYEDIAEMYGKTASQVSAAAIALGARRRARRKNQTEGPGVVGLADVERELAALAAQQEALKRRADELRKKREELSIRFEDDGDDVLVWGVADGAPLRAPRTAWLAFLSAEGGRRLREFLSRKAVSA